MTEQNTTEINDVLSDIDSQEEMDTIENSSTSSSSTSNSSTLSSSISSSFTSSSSTSSSSYNTIESHISYLSQPTLNQLLEPANNMLLFGGNNIINNNFDNPITNMFSNKSYNSSETQTESYDDSEMCSICYKELTIKNSVVTNCDHYYCNTCFYRWIEINATCSICRTPINSKTNLTDEQLEKEHQAVYASYIHTLKKCIKKYELRDKLNNINSNLHMETDMLMKRLVSARELTEEIKSYNEGYLAGAYKFFHGKKAFDNSVYKENKKKRFKNNKYLQRGFKRGKSIECRRLNKISKELKSNFKITKDNTIDLENKNKKKTLFNYGFKILEYNPFEEGDVLQNNEYDDLQGNTRYV